MTYKLIDNPDGIGQRLLYVMPRNPRELAHGINLYDLINRFWGGEFERIIDTGWLNDEYVKISISRSVGGHTIIEIWEV